MHPFSRFVCLALLLGALSSCRPDLTRPVTGTALALQGSVELKLPGRASTPLTLQTAIAPGARMTTGTGAHADLLLLPGLLVELGEKTEIDLIDLRFEKDGDDASDATTRARTARLRLSRGELTAFVLPTRNGKAECLLQTEAARKILRAGRGTLFHLQAEPTEISATCAQGSVSVTPAGGTVDAGHRLAWRAGDSSVVVASENAEPRELSATLLAGYRLQRLQLRLRDTVPAWRRAKEAVSSSRSK